MVVSRSFERRSQSPLDRAPIEDQQLMLDEYGFGHDGTGAARTGEPGDCRQQTQK